MIEATTRWPPQSTTTLAMASPLVIEVTVPDSLLRALSFT